MSSFVLSLSSRMNKVITRASQECTSPRRFWQSSLCSSFFFKHSLVSYIISFIHSDILLSPLRVSTRGSRPLLLRRGSESECIDVRRKAGHCARVCARTLASSRPTVSLPLAGARSLSLSLSLSLSGAVACSRSSRLRRGYRRRGRTGRFMRKRKSMCTHTDREHERHESEERGGGAVLSYSRSSARRGGGVTGGRARRNSSQLRDICATTVSWFTRGRGGAEVTAGVGAPRRLSVAFVLGRHAYVPTRDRGGGQVGEQLALPQV